MLLIAKYLAKILKILNSEISPNQVAAGFAFGALLGLVPAKGLMPVVLFLVALVVNINLVMVMLGAALFKILSYAVDPAANQLGHQLLSQVSALQPLWTQLYNMPLVPYTRFNNTIVMGSLVIGLVLFIPLFFLAKWALVQYRTRYRQRVMQLKLVQIFKTSTFFRLYQTFQGIRGQ
jgi:uncharacterized protein (TIGR03546 family)